MKHPFKDPLKELSRKHSLQSQRLQPKCTHLSISPVQLMSTLLRMTAANCITGSDELKKNCKMVIVGGYPSASHTSEVGDCACCFKYDCPCHYTVQILTKLTIRILQKRLSKHFMTLRERTICPTKLQNVEGKIRFVVEKYF